MELPIATAQYWEQLYQENLAKWNIGQAAPAFVSLLAVPQALTLGKMAVIGCGQGYDALLFAQQGFEVIGFDFAPSAIASAEVLAQTMGITCEFIQRNIFDLPVEYLGDFDYVIEHTCFCAIHPEMRSRYVEMVHSLLKPNGELIALFWAHNRPDGPPFATSLEEIQDLFSPTFNTTNIVPVDNSIDSRQGEEYLARFKVLQNCTT